MTPSLEPANDTRAVWAMHLAARSALIEATRLLLGAEIPSIAVKGVVTAYTLYREPSERPLSDVDIRIRPEDVRRAARVFESAGLQLLDRKAAYGSFVAEVGGVAVDVESVIGAPGLCALRIADLLAGATGFLEGTAVRVPELHDHALLITVNVFKDKLVGAPPWAIEDAGRIVQAPGFDVARFAALARRARVAAIAWIVADWMMGRVGGGVWAAVRGELGGEGGPRRYYAWLFRRLVMAGPATLPTRVVARLGADGPAMRARALWCAFVADWSRGRRVDRAPMRGAEP